MARPLRVVVTGGLYHVIVRGNERRDVFRDDADRTRYLSRLAFYREKFSFRLLAYCLMDNHVHLAIEAGKVPLPRIMAGLQSSYTQYFNRRHGRRFRVRREYRVLGWRSLDQVACERVGLVTELLGVAKLLVEPENVFGDA